MKHLSYLLFSLFLFLFSLFGCGSSPQLEITPGEGLKTPPLSRLSESISDLAPLHLIGKLEVFSLEEEKESLVKSFDLNIQDSPSGLQLIPPEGIKIDGLQEAIYLYRISLFNRSSTQKEDVLLTIIEEKILMKRGVTNGINFINSLWRYDFDDDGDGFANVTELMNGHWDKDQGWVFDPATDPKDGDLHPDRIQSFKNGIGSTTPNSEGAVMLIGGAHSVSSGALVNIIHLSSDGKTVINRTAEFSRLDGSFEILVKGITHGSKLRVYAISLLSKSGENPDVSVSPYISPKNGEESLVFEVP